MPKSTIRLVVIEDDETVRLPLVDVLEAKGYTVFPAINGKKGLDVARKEKPDLIISDIMMPELDGYGVFEALQKDPQTAVIPFIFLTAKTSPEDIREGLGLGVDDYITKPFDFQELLDAIKTRIDRHQMITDAAVTTLNEENEYDQIFVKDGDNCWFVEHEQLRLIESEDNYVRLYFDDEKPLLNRSLNHLQKRLPARLFFRANRKQIINLRWIKHIKPWFNGGLLATLKDNTRIQMSRRAAQAFKSKMGI